ncbi:MAG: DUF4011 domain-containing protein, partial [Mycoplasmataceae bacterium]|nr:DUF4011 domain-containing protein [Mycoplasmataceae bacterium]
MEDKKLTKKQGKYKNILNNLLDIGGVDQAIYTYVNGSKSFDVFSKFGGEVNRTILRNKDFEIRMDEKDLIQLSLMLKRSTTADEIISLYQRFNERLFKTKIALLKQPKHFDATRAELIARLEKKVHSKRTRWLQYINDARSINIQENVWPLHVATLFVSIKTKKRELFAPLLLRPVDAELDGKKIVIKTAGDWVINEKLLFILNQQGHKLKDDFSLKGMTGLSAINTALREWHMKEMFTPYGIFKNKKKEEVVNTDFIQHHGIVLGFFKPNGGQLRKTMFKIIHNNQVDKVLASNKSHKPFDERVNSYIKNNALDLVRIEHSNHSQDKALISSMIQDTIIWGPPGTGKSQVISNIIANILYKGKSAVIMSQKKAALDVLKDRLGAISQFTLFLLNDNNNDKKSFYAPMFKLLKTIRAFKPNEEELNHSYPLISPQEIKGVDLLNRLKKSRDNKTTLLKAKETGEISSLNYREACDYFNRNIEKKLDTKFLVDTLSKNIISKIGTWKEKEPIKFSQFEQCIIDIEEMKLLPIKFIDEYKPLLKEIFPVVISTPETSFVT